MTAKPPMGVNKAAPPLTALREMLATAPKASRPAELCAVLGTVVDGLIAHVEKQAQMIENLRSDLSHKQGIVSKIGGGSYGPLSGTPANDEREP